MIAERGAFFLQRENEERARDNFKSRLVKEEEFEITAEGKKSRQTNRANVNADAAAFTHSFSFC